MVFIVFILTMLSALSAWQRPWLSLPPAWPLRELNAAAGALVGLGVSWAWLVWLRRQRRAGGEALRRWWQALVLALGSAAGALIAFSALERLVGPHPWLEALEGEVTLLALLGALVIGTQGPITWRSLWAGAAEGQARGKVKVIDTSVLIDGRLGELAKTGFIEGKLIVPQFVLQELHTIADSSEPLRRRKGRRGLDILGDLQRLPQVELETLPQDFPQHHDVDLKLIELAKALNADLITTDYNLNKVAKVEGIKVLNINELANAVKPRYLPGEDLEVEVIDRGEEIGQGIGYLDDGTMVVVENGRRFIGKKVDVVVNSTLQTEAGKMLFVRLKGETRQR